MNASTVPDWMHCTFADALDWAVAKHGEQECIVFGADRITFASLQRRVTALARGLIAHGVQQHEHVALWMSDRVEWLVARWAIALIGAVLVPVNTRLRRDDVHYVLKQADIVTLIIEHSSRDTNYYAILEQLDPDAGWDVTGAWRSARLPCLRRVIGFGGDITMPPRRVSLDELERIGEHFLGDGVLDARRCAVRPDDIVQILYTSGTTSVPKGAQLCHGQLLRNNFQTTLRMGLSPRDRFLSCVPLFSATGTGYSLSMLLAGATVVIIDRFEAQRFCETVERERITVTFMVDAIVEDLKAFGQRAEYDLSSLRTGTGAPLSPASFQYASEVVGIPELIGVFGMSETSNAVTRGHRCDPYEKRSRTNGRPVEGVGIRIADVETNEELPAGRIGEICVSGYVLMKGYYKLPEEDRKAIDEAGWLHTGDLGEVDEEGYLTYRGRVKEMIKPGGFNVATQEIEVFLKTYPGVKEAVVVGVPDARLGEVAYAYVEVRAGTQVKGEALQRYCKEHIAGYKVPRYVEFVDTWPLTGSQKIRKLELKDRAARARAAAIMQT
jgi:fatty-acyl-CoA synthase